MDITIYYTPSYKEAPSGIERHSTPLESDWNEWQVAFGQDEKATDTWYLAVKQWGTTGEKSESGWALRKKLLKAKQMRDIANYVEWLEERVALIEVDGHTFWANQSLGAEGEE